MADASNDSTATTSLDSNGKPDVWLSDVDYFDASGFWETGAVTKDNWGNDHSHSINRTYRNWDHGNAYRVYNLKNEYSTLTGIFFQEYGDRSEGGQVILSFIDNEKEELLWKGIVGRAIDPVPFRVNVEGVNKLKLELTGDDAYRTSIGEAGLWK